MQKPAKYQPSYKYKPEYCELVVKFMAEGKSFTQFAAHIDVCRDVLYQWAKRFPEFDAAKKRASQAAQAWWEDLCMRAAQDGPKNYNVVAIIFSMKNRFKSEYADQKAADDESNNITLAYNIKKPTKGQDNGKETPSEPTPTADNLQGESSLSA